MMNIAYDYPATADLFLFMGQSNMAGRGISCERWPEQVPQLIQGAGYEYRAISDPEHLYQLEEPFGKDENNPEGINDGVLKSGSLVTAFVNTYYTDTGIPVIGISASKGGSSILQWQPDGTFLMDTINRQNAARKFLNDKNIKIRHEYILWCQGETDGDRKMSAGDYKKNFRQMFDAMKKNGIETCFLIRIGEYNGAEEIDYSEIRKAQTELCEEYTDVILVSAEFERMKKRGLMKDAFHYYQAAYNEVGCFAGKNTAEFVKRQ